MPRPAPRKRRTPEEARSEILVAAQRLLAERGPDAIGLKDVAKEAGVSHALVSHYFGTYDALVEAALREHVLSARAETLARIADAVRAGPRDWVDMTFEQLAHPLSGRLIAWTILSGRMEHEDFFPRREQGMKLVADAIEARVRAELGDDAPPREEIERTMLLVFSAALGYSVARSVMWSSLSRAPTAERDRGFREWLASFVAESLPGARALSRKPVAAPPAKKSAPKAKR